MSKSSKSDNSGVILRVFYLCLFAIGALVISFPSQAKDEVLYHKCFLEHIPSGGGSTFMLIYEIRESCAGLLSHDITAEAQNDINDIQSVVSADKDYPFRLNFKNNSKFSITKICFDLADNAKKILANSCFSNAYNSAWWVSRSDSSSLILQLTALEYLALAPGKNGFLDIGNNDALKIKSNGGEQTYLWTVQKVEGF